MSHYSIGRTCLSCLSRSKSLASLRSPVSSTVGRKMKRRDIIKFATCAPFIALVKPYYAFACPGGNTIEKIIIPSSTLNEKIEQSSFFEFITKYRTKRIPFSDYKKSKEIKIAVPSNPEYGSSFRCTVLVNKALKKQYCRRIHIYAESEGRSAEQYSTHKSDNCSGIVNLATTVTKIGRFTVAFQFSSPLS